MTSITELRRPFSQACENNKQAILAVLQKSFSSVKQVLEIGSGTGQHAVFFAEALNYLKWQPSDRYEHLAGIQLWLDDYLGNNMLELRELDVEQETWPQGFDAVFSANTAHIMPWALTKTMIAKVGAKLPPEGIFALYGPFNYQGKFTSQSNAEFDHWLRERGAHHGIRAFEKVNQCALEAGLKLLHDHEMPANNRMLIWSKLSK